MTRKNFLKNFAALGLASPFMSTLLASCSQKNPLFEQLDVNFNGKVIIVGAGSAGLIAGHILQQNNIDFEILEASSIFGGRVKKMDGFADFPIDLGAEWIHTDPSILATLLNDSSTTAEVDIVTYNPQTYKVWKNGVLKNRNIASHFYSEYKFKSSTWYDFFEDFIVPNFADKIRYNSPVSEIDYSEDKILIKTTNNDNFEADKVLVTVPITILQNEFITFTPALPSEKQTAINDVDMPDGLKVFLEFEERFYPDITALGSISADRIYYDAAFGKDTNRNVLALFCVGEEAIDYVSLGSEEAIFQQVMSELDEMFDGKASEHYIKHIVQNWSGEPFVQGAYTYNDTDVETLAATVNGKLYFAGEAMNLEGNTSTVHGAGESGFHAVREILMG